MTVPLPELNQEVCPECLQPVAIHQPTIPVGRSRYRCPQHGDVSPLRRVTAFASGAWAWEVRDGE